MNILFLNLYSQKISRGAETFIHELADRLSANHQVTFIKGNSAFLPKHQFTGSLLSKLLKRLFLDKPARQVFFFSLKQIPHILTAHYHIIIPLNGFWQLLILKILQPFKNYKIVVTGHSGPGWDERWNLYLHPNSFVATTQPTLEWAKHTCSWTSSTLIPYGIDPSTYNMKPASIKLPRPIILCPAALVPYKRIDLAIKAVSQLKHGSLVILGKGQLQNTLSTLGNQLLPNRFLVTSAPYSHMPAYYASADIITLPSHPQENSPMVFLEALAAGKPIVATDSPRNRWLLENSAIYVDPVNSSAYAQALHQAQTIKITHKPLQKFLWLNILTQYETLFQKIR